MIKLSVYGLMIPTYLKIDKGHLKDHFHKNKRVLPNKVSPAFYGVINYVQYSCWAESLNLGKEG